jgi:hypothetical protein
LARHDHNNEEAWLRHVLTAAQAALRKLHERDAPENQALAEDLERFCREVEERLRRHHGESAA